jgi:hypothetical protein
MDSSTHVLSYDADGTAGTSTAILIATLNANAVAADFHFA